MLQVLHTIFKLTRPQIFQEIYRKSLGCHCNAERGGGGRPRGALRFFFDGGVPQPTMKWGSNEPTTRVKYRVLGTTELSGRVKNGV